MLWPKVCVLRASALRWPYGRRPGLAGFPAKVISRSSPLFIKAQISIACSQLAVTEHSLKRLSLGRVGDSFEV